MQAISFGPIGAAISVSGPDAQGYLHSQLTQDIASMAPGHSARSLLLEPNGHLVAALEVTCREVDSYLVVVDARIADAVASRLRKFLIRTKASVAAPDALHLAASSVAPPDGLAWLAASGFYWRSAAAARDESLDLGGWDALRARYFAPVIGIDIEAGALPNSLGDLRGYVNFTKGCYTGQELIERVDSRKAAAPRRLYAFGSSQAKVQHGDAVFDETKQIGVVTMASGPLVELAPGLFELLGLSVGLEAVSQVGFALLSRNATLAEVRTVGEEISGSRAVEFFDLT